MNRFYPISNQLLKSGTAVGALIRESEFAQSRADFVNKLSISLKEANEARYWFDAMHQTDLISPKSYRGLRSLCAELIKLLVASINTSKSKLKTT